MKAKTIPETKVPAFSNSLAMKMLNVFISPDEVFEEVAAAPPKFGMWLLPTSLVCIMAAAMIQPAMIKHQTLAAAFAGAGDVAGVWTHRQMIGLLDICFGVFAGTFWSALVLWVIGRVCLKARFSFLKAVEITSLTGIILVLGAVTTGLLVTISHDDAARPALSLLLNKATARPPLFAIMDAINVFHLWVAAVLAVGLSRLSGVSFKECAFWVFGYWLFAPIALILLT